MMQAPFEANTDAPDAAETVSDTVDVSTTPVPAHDPDAGSDNEPVGDDKDPAAGEPGAEKANSEDDATTAARKRKGFGIKARLMLAFGAAAAMTVIAASVAWFSYSNIERSFSASRPRACRR